MATIKSFTLLEQSKKLAEILPIESADMCYIAHSELINIHEPFYKKIDKDDIPCWSLVALLGVLPMIRKGEDTANPFIAKTPDDEYYIVYATLTEEVYDSSTHDNPVDVCYE